MPLYESVLIARSEITQQQVDTLVDQIVARIEAGFEDGPKGSVKKREYWGLRALAYKIKKNRKGHYIYLAFEATPKALLETERLWRLNEDMLRFLTVKIDEVDEAPTPVMARRGEDRNAAPGTQGAFRGPRPQSGRFESGRRRGDREDFRPREGFSSGEDVSFEEV